MDNFDEQIFERAAQLVERGWCQGNSATLTSGTPARWEDPAASCFCAAGATMRALWEAGWWCPETQSAAMTMLQRKVTIASKTIAPMKWNDAPERTKEEVAAMLRTKVEV